MRQYTSAHPLNVVVASVRDLSSPTCDALKALSARQPNVHVLQLDVSSESSARDSLAAEQRLTDRLDVLINNAGVGDTMRSSFNALTLTWSDAVQLLSVLPLGPLGVAQTYLSLLRRSPSPRCVQIGSNSCSNAIARRMAPQRSSER